MIHSVLIARAATDPFAANEIAVWLDLSRSPADTADAHALDFWRTMQPFLVRHPGDMGRLLAAGRKAGVGDAVMFALQLPQWLTDLAEPTPHLIEVVNRGEGTAWMLPVVRVASKRAPVQMAS